MDRGECFINVILAESFAKHRPLLRIELFDWTPPHLLNVYTTSIASLASLLYYSVQQANETRTMEVHGLRSSFKPPHCSTYWARINNSNERAINIEAPQAKLWIVVRCLKPQHERSVYLTCLIKLVTSMPPWLMSSVNVESWLFH